MRKQCPICKSSEKAIIRRIHMKIPANFHLPDGYDIVSCEKCGFCYASTEATIDDYDYYYSHCNFYSGVPGESKGKMELNLRAVNLVDELLDKDKQLLDIGYGNGNLMRLLRKQGFNNIFGIDPDSDGVESMRREGFITFCNSIYDEVRNDLAGMFDCVFCFDVLEHLLHPDKALEKIAGYLKKQGYLIVSVPNYAALWDDESILINQFNQEHINYFSLISLDNLMKQFNFYRIDKTGEHAEEKELFVVYAYSGATGNYSSLNHDTNIVKDEICKPSIEDYVKRNEKLEISVNEKLMQHHFNGISDSVYIWGTGSYAMWLLANTMLGQMNVEAFIDNNEKKVGNFFCDRPIISADKMDKDKPILICCMRFYQDIVEQIEKNCSNEYLVL